MTLKFSICTAGQSMKLAFSAGKYTSWILRATARRPPPSVTVMKVKNIASPVLDISLIQVIIRCVSLTKWRKDELIKAHPL